MAYIDENGNITSSPPNPNKRKLTNAEYIQIGVPKQENLAFADAVRNRIVAFYNESSVPSITRNVSSEFG